MFKDFFINFAIITTMISLFHQYIHRSIVNRQSSTRKKIWYGIFTGGLGAVLMQFTIDLYNGLIMDLRHVPLMCAAIYGGPVPTIVTAVILAAVRLSIGGGSAALYAMIFIVVSSVGYITIASRTRNPWLAVFWMMLLSNIVFSFISYPLAVDFQTYLKANMLYWLFSFCGGFSTLHTAQYLRMTKTLFKEYEEKAFTDALTGLNNVRSFDEAMNEAGWRVQDKKETLALAMIDIDFFKKINDTYGHPAGDEILKQLGQLLQDLLPEEMVVSRNGGEEFTVLMENVAEDEAFRLAELVRHSVEQSSFFIEGDQLISMTISVGLAVYPKTPIESLYRTADAALYRAKHSGRNIVCLYDAQTEGDASLLAVKVDEK